MRNVLRAFGIVIVALVLIFAVVAVILYIVGNNNLNETHEVTVAALTVPSGDEDAIARGQHLAEAISLCAECHGDNLGGKEFADSAVFASGDAPNLTTGQGGIGAAYTTEDWVRAVRHGVKPDGTSVVLMPSKAYSHMSDADLAALLAYIESVPPVDNDTDALSLGPIGTIALGVMSDLPYEAIDHDMERSAPPEGATAEYGEYLAYIGGCHDCHGEDLDGNVPMGAPEGPDLTGLGWTEQEFISTLRQGISPDGDQLDPDEMPWDYYTRMSDSELQAIWAYLQTLN